MAGTTTLGFYGSMNQRMSTVFEVDGAAFLAGPSRVGFRLASSRDGRLQGTLEGYVGTSSVCVAEAPFGAASTATLRSRHMGHAGASLHAILGAAAALRGLLIAGMGAGLLTP